MARARQNRANLREREEQRGTLAAVVLGRRNLLGLTQTELADLSRSGARFIHDLESGKATLQLDKVLDVLAVLGIGLSLTDAPGLAADLAVRQALDLTSATDPPGAQP